MLDANPMGIPEGDAAALYAACLAEPADLVARRVFSDFIHEYDEEKFGRWARFILYQIDGEKTWTLANGSTLYWQDGHIDFGFRQWGEHATALVAGGMIEAVYCDGDKWQFLGRRMAALWPLRRVTFSKFPSEWRVRRLRDVERLVAGGDMLMPEHGGTIYRLPGYERQWPGVEFTIRYEEILRLRVPEERDEGRWGEWGWPIDDWGVPPAEGRAVTPIRRGQAVNMDMVTFDLATERDRTVGALVRELQVRGTNTPEVVAYLNALDAEILNAVAGPGAPTINPLGSPITATKWGDPDADILGSIQEIQRRYAAATGRPPRMEVAGRPVESIYEAAEAVRRGYPVNALLGYAGPVPGDPRAFIVHETFVPASRPRPPQAAVSTLAEFIREFTTHGTDEHVSYIDMSKEDRRAVHRYLDARRRRLRAAARKESERARESVP